MASRSRGSSRAVHTAPKRLTQWGNGPGDSIGTQFTVTGSKFLGSGVTFGASGTVIRIRGRLTALLESYTSAGNGYHCAMGIGLVALSAFDAGIASVPTPLTESAWDGWLYHQFFNVHGALAAGSTAVGVTGGFDVAVDTKAMRKVSDEMVIFSVLEVVETATAVMLVFFNSRLLLKLG